ncbi:MAG: permease [Deltaproteobacteria bacterium]|nr:permease [Deltaproteobacteria bacterium]
MLTFVEQAGFFAWELFKFMTFFYVVWAPGFLVSGLLTSRYHRTWWNAVARQTSLGPKGLVRAIGLGIVGSSGLKASINATLDLLKGGVPSSHALAFLIASRNMTIHFWSIFALSLGAEFATGQILGALVMIAIVTLGIYLLDTEFLETPACERPQENRAMHSLTFPSWRSLLFSFKGWQAVLRFTGGEIVHFAPSLVVGILLGGFIFSAGLQTWWRQFADLFGHATLLSDLTNSVVAPFLSSIASLSPVGNLPVIHALFKTDGLSYAGIISFCLASSIHPKDIKAYSKAFGRKKALALIGTLYVAAVLGGLGSTWIYAALGFRPSLPPVKLASKLVRTLLEYLGF